MKINAHLIFSNPMVYCKKVVKGHILLCEVSLKIDFNNFQTNK